MAKTYSYSSNNLAKSNREINAMMLVPLINEDIESLLNDYFSFSPLQKVIKLNNNFNGFYNFNVP